MGVADVQADEFRRTLSSKIDAARRAFDPSMRLTLLTFNDVSCSYSKRRAGGSSKTTTVLKAVSGLVAPGWMVAIMVSQAGRQAVGRQADKQATQRCSRRRRGT